MLLVLSGTLPACPYSLADHLMRQGRLRPLETTATCQLLLLVAVLYVSGHFSLINVVANADVTVNARAANGGARGC